MRSSSISSIGFLIFDDFDFKQPAPILSRDEDAPRGCVVGDAIEYVGCGSDLLFGQQSREVHDPFDRPRSGIDDDDLVGGVDVGPDLSFDPFQFVEELHGAAGGRDRDLASAPERVGIDLPDVLRTVAQIERLSVGGEPQPSPA